MTRLEFTHITLSTPLVEEYLTIAADYDPTDRCINGESVTVTRETHWSHGSQKGAEKADMRLAYNENKIIALLVAQVDWEALYSDYLEAKEQAVTDSVEN